MNKALRGLEVGASGFDEKIEVGTEGAREKILQELKVRSRAYLVCSGCIPSWFHFRRSICSDQYRPLVLVQIEDIINTENQIKTLGFGDLNADNIRSFKRKGLSDLRIANLMGISQNNSVNTVGTGRNPCLQTCGYLCS